MRTVKSRPGTVRAERAGLTRQAIKEAARRCFHSSGYAATTLREIADEAGVAVQTVYAAFGSKANILRALRLDVIGDEEADAAWAQALGAPDSQAAIDAFARSIRLRWEHGADVVAINREAARADVQVRAEVEVADLVRRTGIAEVAAALVAGDAELGPVTLVAAQLEALTVTTVYEVLTAGHGWAPELYERWLAGVLADALARNRASDRR